MKIIYKLLSFGVILGSSITAFAQKDNVGIGTTKPDNSAALEVSSTNKGLLMPRLSLQQRNNIQTPATGLIVYQTDMLSGFYFYNGKEWQPLTSATDANSVAGVDGDWTLIGNAATATDFLGTTNSQPLRFKVNNVASGAITTSSVFLGKESGKINTGLNNIGIGSSALIANTTGASNVAIGTGALSTNISGSNNFAIGTNALKVNTASDNMALGLFALQTNTTGNLNTAIGKSALELNQTGLSNVAVGLSALRDNVSGSRNTAVGLNAGRLTAGSGNVYIGYEAGRNETGSNRLYIANTSTAAPLIKGEFDNKNLKINTGSSVSQTVGFLAVGNFDAAFPMPSPTNTYRLIVEGGMITEKIKVAIKGSADWADYVFEPSYKLMPLENVETFVKENKHLPNVPSAEEMAKNGLDVSQTSAKLMEKIEELTLYMIELNKEVKTLKIENESLKNKLK